MTALAAILSFDPLGDRLRPGAGAGAIVLVSFLISYLAIRTSARLTRSVSWWPGGVETEGGVHLHHLVWGIMLMLFCGFLAFAAPLGAPWWHLIAIGFGVGAGFTLDEFALWVHLEDVYWSEAGRMSFDAVVCTLAFGVLVVIGTRPFGLDQPASAIATGVKVAVILVFAFVSIAKGRVLLGIVGIFIPIFAIWGTIRLAHPASIWAKRFYGPQKRARAEARFAPGRPMMRAGRRLSDAIAGKPSDELPAREGS